MTSGIYRIHCPSNGESYVGQAKDIDRRWQQHRADLERGKHCNDKLQAAWNRYGSQSLDWSILERCPEWRLDGAEAYWIRHCGTMNEVKPACPLYGWWGLIHLAIAILIALPLFAIYCGINPPAQQEKAIETTKI